MDDHDLTARLRRAADSAGDPRPDLAEVELGAARVRGRRRWATGVVAAMLIAGAGGAGFGLGRAAGDSDRATSADGDPVEAPVSADEGSDPTDPPVDTVPAPEPDPEPEPEPAEADTPVVTVVEEAVDSDVADPVAATDSAESAVTVPAPYPGSGSYTLVYERALPNGLRVRMLEGPTFETGYMVGEWAPAAWCFPNVEARITIDGPDVVDVTGASVYADATALPAGVWAQRTDVGVADSHPLRLLIAQAPGAASVTVRWADGPTDTTEVVAGLAVLATDGTEAWNTEYELDVVGVDGATTTLSSATIDQAGNGGDAEWRETCQPPPPALPDPGEQPADPAAAEAALQADFQGLWDDIRAGVESDRLDDWTGIADAIGSVQSGGFSDVAATAVHVIEEVSFQSPTAAWFRYGIDTTNGYFGERYGTAVLTDSGWQFPRAVPCNDLGLAGGGCHPAEPPILPPSWFELNGESGYGECSEDGSDCWNCTVYADGREECFDGRGNPLEGPPSS